MKVDAERRAASEKLETIVITSKGYNQNLRIAESKLITKYIIPETQLSQNDEGEDVQVSIETNKGRVN